jgi:hypothetical protein
MTEGQMGKKLYKFAPRFSQLITRSIIHDDPEMTIYVMMTMHKENRA